MSYFSLSPPDGILPFHEMLSVSLGRAGQVSFAAISEDAQAQDFLSFQELLHLCAFPQALWLCPSSPSDVVLEPLQCLICPHVTDAVCLLFAFDLEEIKVT